MEIQNQQSTNKDIKKIYALVEKKKYSEAKKILISLHYADIADIIDQLHMENDELDFILHVSDDIPIKTFSELNHYTLIKIFSILEKSKLASIINQIDLSDAVNIIEQLPPEIREKTLQDCKQETAQKIKISLSHLDNSIGRAMNHNIILIQESWDVTRAVTHIKKNRKDKINFIIITDNKSKPLSYINISELLFSKKEEKVSELKKEELKVVNTHTPLDEVTYLFKQYEVNVVCIINKTGKIVGAIYEKDVIELISEQTEDYITQLGGLKNANDIFANFESTIKRRFPWLVINLFMSFSTLIIINYFSNTISKTIALAAIMPVITSLSSNAGIQVMTITIRLIATNQDNVHKSMTTIVNKELIVSFFNAIGLSIIGSLLVWISYKQINLTLIFSLSTIANLTFFSVIGCLIPITLDKLKIDPAFSSSTIINYLADFISCSSFLLLSYLILK